VHDFKFRGETARSTSLAGYLEEACQAFGTTATLVPVPMHRSRKRERGYDQAAILVRAIGKATGQPMCELLVKERATPAQVGLTAAARSLNLIEAFAVRPGVPIPDAVILVDDVATTGSTLTECARVLRKAGASSVSAVVIAHGL